MEIQVFSLSATESLNHSLYLSFSQRQPWIKYPLNVEELQQKKKKILQSKLISKLAPNMTKCVYISFK